MCINYSYYKVRDGKKQRYRCCCCCCRCCCCYLCVMNIGPFFIHFLSATAFRNRFKHTITAENDYIYSIIKYDIVYVLALYQVISVVQPIKRCSTKCIHHSYVCVPGIYYNGLLQIQLKIPHSFVLCLYLCVAIQHTFGHILGAKQQTITLRAISSMAFCSAFLKRNAIPIAHCLQCIQYTFYVSLLVCKCCVQSL